MVSNISVADVLTWWAVGLIVAKVWFEDAGACTHGRLLINSGRQRSKHFYRIVSEKTTIKSQNHTSNWNRCLDISLIISTLLGFMYKSNNFKHEAVLQSLFQTAEISTIHTMKKLNLKNLKDQKIESSKSKQTVGAGFPGYYCGDYYCTYINPAACCC